MSVLDPSYMIDLGGIDVIQSQGVAIPGLYQKLLDNIGPCGNPLIYNWKFNGVFIPPQFVEPILEDDAIYINDIYVSSDDVVHIPSIERPPVTVQLNVSENGEYEAPEGVDGYNPVVVDVENGVPLLTRAQWDALTTQEKQAYGLVAIQDASSGYMRGNLVNGADYMPPIPLYSNGVEDVAWEVYGGAVKELTKISLRAGAGVFSSYACIVSPIDITSRSAISLNYSRNNQEQSEEVDISQVSGIKYIGFYYLTDASHNEGGVFVNSAASLTSATLFKLWKTTSQVTEVSLLSMNISGV